MHGSSRQNPIYVRIWHPCFKLILHWEGPGGWTRWPVWPLTLLWFCVTKHTCVTKHIDACPAQELPCAIHIPNEAEQWVHASVVHLLHLRHKATWNSAHFELNWNLQSNHKRCKQRMWMRNIWFSDTYFVNIESSLLRQVYCYISEKTPYPINCMLGMLDKIK